MKHLNPRNDLMANTIKVIASEGLDKTTTKSIVRGTGINEAYIYRFFSDKEELLARTFDMLDEELVDAVSKNSEIMLEKNLEFEVRARLYFRAVWRFLLSNREKCVAYVRYFYSPYFKKHSAEAHKERFAEYTKYISVVFNEKANVWMILNHILNVMLDFAVKVFDGAVGDNEDTEEHVFRLVYVSVKQYFNKDRDEEKIV